MYSNIEKRNAHLHFAKFPYHTHLLSSKFHTKIANATLVLSNALVMNDATCPRILLSSSPTHFHIQIHVSWGTRLEYCGDFHHLAESDSETVCDCRPHRKLDQQTVFLLRVASPTSEIVLTNFSLFLYDNPTKQNLT